MKGGSIMNETINTIIPAIIPVNYLAMYHKNQEEFKNRAKTFFADLDAIADTKQNVIAIKKKLDTMKKTLNYLETELKSECSKVYKENYEEYPKEIYIRYECNRGYRPPVYYYTYPGGVQVNSENVPDNSCIAHVGTKRDEVTIPVGFSYSVLGVIVKNIKVNISGDNSSCKYTDISESLYPIMTPDTCIRSSGFESYSDYDKLADIDGMEFIKKVYGVENREIPKKDLKWYWEKMATNKSFEIILKTAPEDIMEALLERKTEESIPVYKLLGIEQKMYNMALEKIGSKSLIDMSVYFSKKIFNKTPEEWLDYIDMVQHYIEDLKFYAVDLNCYGHGYGSYRDFGKNGVPKMCENETICYMCSQYEMNEVLNKNYSLSKFTSYVLEETINQGYGSVKEYVTALVDYIQMCNGQGVKPSLYTNNINLNHNITLRNYKVVVAEHEEEVFANQYKEDKKWTSKDGKYIVIPPEKTEDIKKEGSELNHCCSSYIARIIKGETKIFFLRRKETPNESLVTLEIHSKAIHQARGMYNRGVTDEERAIIKEYADKMEYECSYAH